MVISIIKKRLILLYFLNVTDLLFTSILLNTGCFIELNPFMKPIINNYNFSIPLKCLLPMLLFYVLYIRMQKATNKQLEISNKFIYALLISYVVINISHLINIFLITVL